MVDPVARFQFQISRLCFEFFVRSGTAVWNCCLRCGSCASTPGPRRGAAATNDRRNKNKTKLKIVMAAKVQII